jgi:hypothetical protein
VIRETKYSPLIPLLSSTIEILVFGYKEYTGIAFIFTDSMQ